MEISEAELIKKRRLTYLIQKSEEETRIIETIRERLLQEGIEDNDDWKNELLEHKNEE